MALPRNYFKPGMKLKADDLNDIARRIRALQQRILSDSSPSADDGPAWIPEEQKNLTEPWCCEFFRSTYKTDGEVVPYVYGGEVITNLAIDTNGEAHFVYTKPFEEDWIECQDFEFEDNGPLAPTPPVFVWLECTGDEPEPVDINFGDYYPPETFGYTQEDVQSGKKLTYPHGFAVRQGKLRWRVTAKPREDALRVWPLAAIHYDDEEPITMLQWGDLSMLEIRGIKDINGKPLFPGQNNPTGNRFFDKNYGQGMAPLCDIDFSVGSSHLQGILKGRIDNKAALELFLANDFNPYEENSPYNPGNVENNDDDWDDPNNLVIPDDFYDPADPPPPTDDPPLRRTQ